MFDSTSSKGWSFPPNRPSMPPKLRDAILRDAFNRPAEELSERQVSMFFCERGLDEYILKGQPFTAAMVTRRLPIKPVNGHLGLIIGSWYRARYIKLVGLVYRDYPEESGQPTRLWVAKSW